MPSNYTVSDIRAKSLTIKTLGNGKVQVTVMLALLVDSSQLPPCVILNAEQCLEESSDANLSVR
jgi:hypothetical protein